MKKQSIASREPEWHEMNDQMKIEKLREIIRQQGFLLKKMADSMGKLMDHEHVNGKIMTILKRPNEESYGDFIYPAHLDKWL